MTAEERRDLWELLDISRRTEIQRMFRYYSDSYNISSADFQYLPIIEYHDPTIQAIAEVMLKEWERKRKQRQREKKRAS